MSSIEGQGSQRPRQRREATPAAGYGLRDAGYGMRDEGCEMRDEDTRDKSLFRVEDRTSRVYLESRISQPATEDGQFVVVLLGRTDPSLESLERNGCIISATPKPRPLRPDL